VASTGSFTAGKVKSARNRRSTIYGIGKRDLLPSDNESVSEESVFTAPDSEEQAAANLTEILRDEQQASVSTKAMEIIMSGKIKQIQQMEMDFYRDLPRICGDIMEHVSLSAATRIREYPGYEDAISSSDMLGLWEIIKNCSILTPGDKTRQITDLREQREALYQLNKPLDVFCEQFSAFESELVDLGRPTPEDELILHFLDRLHPLYCSYISQLRVPKEGKPTGDMPTSFLQVKAIIKAYESIAIAQARQMKGGKDNSSIFQEAALLTQAGSGKDKSERKPKPDKKNEQSNQDQVAAAVVGDKKHEKKDEKKDQKGLTQCAFCLKWGRHTAQDCNLLKAKNEKQAAGEKVHVTTESNRSNTRVVLPIIADDNNDSLSEPNMVLPVDSQQFDNAVFLDNACTVHTIRNKSLLRNFRAVEPRMLHGLGTSLATHGGDLPHFGFALFMPTCPLNLISFKQAKIDFTRHFSEQGEYFLLKKKDDGAKFIFNCNLDGLYQYNMGTPSAIVHPNVSEPNYTNEQIRRAKCARELHQMLNHPNDKDLCKGIENGCYLDCTVTTRDVQLAQQILGPCTDCIAAKMTAEPSPPSTNERSNVIGEKQHVDLFFSKGNPYMISVDSCTGCISVCPSYGKAKKKIVQALAQMISAFKSYGHTVKYIVSDRESVFNCAEIYLNNKGIQLNHSGPGRHEKRAERAIRTVKSKCRTVLQSLPYNLPQRLYPYLFSDCALSCNLVPTTQSGNLTTREIVTGVKLNAKVHLRAKFGDIVLCKTPTDSKQVDEPRAELGIVVGRDLNSKGDLKVYLFDRDTVLYRHTFTKIPMTPEAEERIQLLYEADHDDEDTFGDDEDHEDQPSLDQGVGLPIDLASQAFIDRQDVFADEDAIIDEHDYELSTEQGSELPVRYSLRPNRSNWKHREFNFNISVKSALNEYNEAAKESILNEFQQLIAMGVWKPIKRQSLTQEERKKIIPCSMFLKVKNKPDGSFDKLKSRLVAGGHRQDLTLYDDVSSPCVNITSVFMILGISVYEQLDVSITDVKAAYVNAELKSVKVRMIFRGQLVQLLTEVYLSVYKQDITPYIEPDGSLLVEVLKALYGLVEAALLWYQHLTGTLQSIGYSVSKHDRGVLFKHDTNTNKKAFICIHVDDILLSTNSKEYAEELKSCLIKAYKDINVQENTNQLFYLGMQLDMKPEEKSVHISQPGFIKDILTAHPVSKGVNCPAAHNLFENDEKAAKVDVTSFASRLMKLSFLAKRSRPDLSLVVSYLATRMKDPNEHDEKKLVKAYEYLNQTQDLPLVLSPNSLTLHGWFDASYAVHGDMKSHSGIIICLGTVGAPIFSKSSKQKMTADSSTFSELIALHEGTHYLQWALRLLNELGYHQNQPAIIHQDNKSTIVLANKGPGTVARSKHFPIRFFYVKECIDNKEATIEHEPTETMRSDGFTKPLTGKYYIIFLGYCLGRYTR
jgi:hypothetical protein